MYEQNLSTDGIIELDSDLALKLGFTSDKFLPLSYLWLRKGTIVISAIASKQKGAFRQLMENIDKLGFGFEIPTPCDRMMEIGEKQRWVLIKKADDLHGEINVLTNNKRLTLIVRR